MGERLLFSSKTTQHLKNRQAPEALWEMLLHGFDDSLMRWLQKFETHEVRICQDISFRYRVFTLAEDQEDRPSEAYPFVFDREKVH